MFGKHQADVLVAGAGPVGLFAAAGLVRRGVDVTIVDEEWQGTGLSYALALHPGSIRLLEELDLARNVIDEAYRVEKVVFYEGTERRAALDLTTLSVKFPFLAIVPQNVLELELEQWLKAHHRKVSWRHRVAGFQGEARPVEVTMERWAEDSLGYAVARRARVVDQVSSTTVQYVIGADGHNSAVRRHLGIDFPALREPDLFAVFEFQTDLDLSHEVRVILDPGLTSVLWPLPLGRARWSFQLHDASEFEGARIKNRLSEFGRWVLPALDQSRLGSLIEERAPWFEGHVKDILWSVAIRFEHRLASSFGRGALWLAGDSAHLAGPVGMHSLNVGLREAHDLAERIAGVLHGSGSPTDVEGYDEERRAEWRMLSGEGRGALGTGRADSFVAKNAARILECTPASGAELRTLLGQVGLSLPER